MSGPSDQRPPQQAGPPTEAITIPRMTTAPETKRRIWPRKVPARIGRARTSTAILAALFVLFSGLYVAVRPEVVYTTVTTTTGQTVRVPASQLSTPPSAERSRPASSTDEPEQTGRSAPTTSAPGTGTSTSSPTTGREQQRQTAAPTTTAGSGDDEPTEQARPTQRTTQRTSQAPATSPAPATSAAPTG